MFLPFMARDHKAKNQKIYGKSRRNPKAKVDLESNKPKLFKKIKMSNFPDLTTTDGQRVQEIMNEEQDEIPTKKEQKQKKLEKMNKTIRKLMEKNGWTINMLQATIDDIDSEDSERSASEPEEEEDEMAIEIDEEGPSTSTSPTPQDENPAKRIKYDWVTPKKPVKTKQNNDKNKQNKENKKELTEKPKTDKKDKVPPIKTKRVESGILDKTLKEAGIPVKYKVNKDESITVKCATNVDHEKVMTLFRGAEIDGHSYTPEAQKKTVLVMKGAHSSLEIKDIVEDIEFKTGIKVTAKRMETTKSRKGNYQLNNVLITVDKEQAKEVKKIRETMNHIIYWEPLRNTLVTQCYNCQELGHIARYCLNAYQCVKCNEKHLPKQCKKKMDDGKLPYCHLCGKEGHPANFRGCPKIIEMQENINKKKIMKVNNARQQIPHQETQAPVTIQYNRIPYSQMLRGPPIVPQAQPNMSFFNGECQRLFGMDMMSVINRTREFAPIYKSAQNEHEQRMLLLDFMMTLC